MTSRNSTQRRSLRNKSRNVRRLFIEPLEDRRLLATLTVNTNSGSAAVDNQLSVYEAINIAAGTSGDCLTDAERDQIVGADFVPALAGPFCVFNPFTTARWTISGGAGAGIQDKIVFATNVSTISPTVQLPDVGCLDKIDGLEGRSSKVRLHGGSAGDASGLALFCEDNSFTWIRNLEITGFQRDGITSFSPKSLFQGLELFNNRESGLHLFHVGDSQIGGPDAGQRNVIYDNDLDGIRLEGSGGNRIENNFIGLKPNGDSATGNRGHGISMFGVAGGGGPQGNNTIGGSDPGLGNVISGNSGFGVSLFNGFAVANIVFNNTIGLNASQTAKRGNGNGGVSIAGGSSNNQVLANLIAGNNGPGVLVEHNGGSGGADNLVRNNFIGTNYALATNLGNASDGVLTRGVPRTTIDGNIIQANAGAGVHLSDLPGATVDSVIASNVISSNTGDGVFIEGPGSTRNAIRNNSISSNGQLGIDLDGGANNGQNRPNLTNAYPNGTNTNVEGSLSSAASTAFVIQFFHSGECDPSGSGEGQQFVGELVQSTNGGGNLSFTTTFATTVPTGQFITATATNQATGNTSEFSPCRIVTPFGGSGRTLTWTGNNSDKWNDSNNWDDEFGNDALPVGGERLVFPAVAQNFTPLNNLNLVDPSFESITILGTGYVISGNTLRSGTIFSAGNTINTLTLGIKPGAFFNVANKAQLVLRGVMSGPASVGLVKQGAGELVIDGANTYTGVTYISEGTLKLASGGLIPDSSAVQVAAGALFHLDGFSETIGSLAGSGVVQLAGATLNAGTNGDSTTFFGVITGAGDLAKSGAGTMTLSGHNNNYSGATRINVGHLQLGASEVIPDGSVLVMAPGTGLLLGDFSETVGSLDGGGSVSGNGNFTAGGNGNSTTFTGNIGGFGQFTKTGAGTMDVSGSLGKIVNNINGGSLRFQANGVLCSFCPLQINGGTLDLNGFNQTVSSGLSMAGGVIETQAGTLTLASDVTTGGFAAIHGKLSLGGATRTVNAAGYLTISANTSDGAASSGLTKTGVGTLLLDSGAYTHTGATRVEAGTLILKDANIANSAVTVSAGGRFESARSCTIGALTLDGGTVLPDGFDDADRLVTQALMLNSGTLKLNFETAAEFGYDDISVTGSVTLNGNIAITLALEFNPQDNVDVFRIIRNDGTDPTVRNGDNARFVFGGNVLEDGEVFNVTTGLFTQFFEIRYGLTAGDNDVRLIALPTANQFVVNSTTDTVDANLVDDLCNDGNGKCTLRAAIQQANATANNPAGPDVIKFNIPGAGPHSIAPTSALPLITGAVVIDGTTEPDFVPGGLPVIELNGIGAGAGTNGLFITAGNSTVRGLVINRFTGAGIRLQTGGGNTIAGNFIGTDQTGTLDRGNTNEGILVVSSPSNTIGGTVAVDRNVISGNNRNGVEIDNGPSTGNVVRGNFIGTNRQGTAALANSLSGIVIYNAPSNTVGGTTAGAGNVISGNLRDGVVLIAAGSTSNLVQGNRIGTDVTGTLDRGNAFSGVRVDASSANNTIGGTTASARNILSGNTDRGLHILSGATGNLVQGNYIGIDASGTADLGNSKEGVLIYSAGSNTIGGTTAGAGNVISGNDRNGVEIDNPTGTNNIVRGNFIGTNSAGTAALGNSLHGVLFYNAPGNTLGGTAAGAANVISGNLRNGVLLTAGTANTTLQGNLIGTDVTGTLDRGNVNSGVRIESSNNNTVGGTAAGARNIISGNNEKGVYLLTGSTGNVLQGNFIGTNITGTADLGNSQEGVLVASTGGNTIGGTVAGAGNVISGNDRNGIEIDNPTGTNNTVRGNFIGTNFNGTAAIGNTLSGVLLFNADSNSIGGTAAGAANKIGFNGLGGVRLTGTGTRNAIQRNSIFSNTGLGIELPATGVTPNDVNDPDAGANNLQNFPVFASVVLSGANLNITYSVPSIAPNSTFPLAVEFFIADAANQEGQTFLGSNSYTTPGSKLATIPAGTAVLGTRIVATATDANGNTSEFSANATVANALMAAGGAARATASKPAALTSAQLAPIVDAAILRLISQGLTGAQVKQLSSVTVGIADLPGATLGLATSNAITLDANAAGYGWYVDATPHDDSEFSSGTRPSTLDSQLLRMDLLTAVMHELSHTLGLNDLHAHGTEDDLMYEALAAGVRRT